MWWVLKGSHHTVAMNMVMVGMKRITSYACGGHLKDSKNTVAMNMVGIKRIASYHHSSSLSPHSDTPGGGRRCRPHRQTCP